MAGVIPMSERERERRGLKVEERDLFSPLCINLSSTPLDDFPRTLFRLSHHSDRSEFQIYLATLKA